MNTIIIRFAYRECAFYVVPILIAMFAYFFLTTLPLRFFDMTLCVLSVALGFSLAKKPFADDGGVRAFMFSRSFHPKRLFLVRWAFGAGVITAVTLLFAAFMAFGIREAVQKSLFENGWYPMVRYLEMHVLWNVWLGGMLSFQTTIFFVVRNRFLAKPKLGFFSLWIRRTMNLLLALLGIAVVFAILYLGTINVVMRLPYNWPMYPFLLIIFGIPAAVQTLLTPWFGVYCYNQMEIES